MTNVIPFNKQKEPESKCSFCGTSKSKVRKLFTNNAGKFICDACVIKSKKLMDESETSE